MSIFTARPALRWLVPAGVALAVIGGGAATRAIVASADPTLPDRSAAQLLVDVQSARLDGLSGTVVASSDLGLPQLPIPAAGAGGGNLNLLSLATGKHTARVWYSGPDKARFALLSQLGETDLIRSGRDCWVWNSQSNTAVHSTIPAEPAGDRAGGDRDGGAQRNLPTAIPSQIAGLPSGLPTALPTDPAAAAKLALAAIDPTTVVSTAGSARVAGRSAYELVLAPRDTSALVSQVRIAIDAERHVPLRVEVFPQHSESAAFESAFTEVNFNRPDPGQFVFNPPPGAKVEQATDVAGAPGTAAGTTADRPRLGTVLGTGWTAVAVAVASPTDLAELAGRMGSAGKAGSAPGANAGNDQLNRLVQALPEVSGPWGSGHVFSARIFSVLVTDDGRLLAGAVTTQRLTEVAADPAASVATLKAAR